MSEEVAVSANQNAVLLFDEAGATYLCSMGVMDCHEFYRQEGQSWLRVDRSRKSNDDEYVAAGVPKTLSWQRPSLTVYTWGKQEVGKGGLPNRATKKYYQWCQSCCAVSCGAPVTKRGGCTKPRCWIAPKKWKQHATSQCHLASLQSPLNAALRGEVSATSAQQGCRHEYLDPRAVGTDRHVILSSETASKTDGGDFVVTGHYSMPRTQRGTAMEADATRGGVDARQRELCRDAPASSWPPAGAPNKAARDSWADAQPWAEPGGDWHNPGSAAWPGQPGSRRAFK